MKIADALKALSVLTDGEIISVTVQALAHVGSRVKVTFAFPDEPEACDGDPSCRKIGCETCDDHFGRLEREAERQHRYRPSPPS